MTLLCYPKRAEVPGLAIHTIRCERMEEERFSCRLPVEWMESFKGTRDPGPMQCNRMRMRMRL